ncbi:DUF3757 domain-containing protein [Luteibacter sp. E-22]|uniref:DUF3757 domain-containing protein n=1 Tax=Luteibacter sp. E-22 TaxID=3404050 RepID=UPI003CF5624F
MRALFGVIATLISPVTAAYVIEHCPQPSTIVNHHGVHKATAQDSRYEWVGVAPAGNDGNVLRFEEAVFYPGGETATDGELARCSYKLERGALDMAYLDTSGRPKVRLHDRHAWTRELGPFGIVYHKCTATDGVGCTFRAVEE